MNKIVVISFKSPPYSEVGAYRWSKIIKYLSRNNIFVHLLTVNWKNSYPQPWHDEINNKNVRIHRISSLYPHNFKYKKYASNFFGKILNKFRNQVIKILSLFYYIDEAQMWGYKLLPYLLKLIKKEKIKLIIATGAPFMVNYWASFFKKNILNDIILIHDFRDEWNEYRNFLFNWQRKDSLKKELFTLINSDAVVTVSEGLKKLFSDKVQEKSIYVIPNGFDEEVLNKISFNEKKKRDFSFIYAGSLSNNRDKPLFTFLDVVREIKDSLIGIKIKLFISRNDAKVLEKKYKDLILEDILLIKGLIPQDKLFSEIYNTFVALHFMPETQSFIISIKLFEYAFLRRPILSLNFGGDTDTIIKEYSLGYSLLYKENKDEINKILNEIYNLWKRDPFYEIDFNESLKKFSYESLSIQYRDLIVNLLKERGCLE